MLLTSVSNKADAWMNSLVVGVELHIVYDVELHILYDYELHIVTAISSIINHGGTYLNVPAA